MIPARFVSSFTLAKLPFYARADRIHHEINVFEMINDKPAPTDKAIAEVIKNRWSPRAISEKPVPKEVVETLLEAARWAPSSFNEQPWQYLVGYNGDETFEKIAACLLPGNDWATKVGVLMISIAKDYFEHNHNPNRHYMYDTGAADVLIHLQATEMGLYMHQMAGFDMEKVRETFNVGRHFEPCSIIAIGYPGNNENLDEKEKEREEAPRSRKSLDDMYFTQA